MNDKARILIVDDESASLFLIHTYLKDIYETRIAASGEEAISIAGTWKPDLLLLDIVLPGISGIELCKNFSTHSEYCSIPVIMVTAKNEDRDLKDGLEAGAIDYIRKPYSKTELKARIKSALRLKESIELLNKSNAEKEEIILQLKEALANVKKLSGLLPICSNCKSIRNDRGYWERVENYLEEHSTVTFTHGLCEDCARKLYPEMFDKDEK